MSLTFSKLYILYLFNNNNNNGVILFFIYTIAKERLILPTDWLQWIYGTEPRKQNNPPLFKKKNKTNVLLHHLMGKDKVSRIEGRGGGT